MESHDGTTDGAVRTARRGRSVRRALLAAAAVAVGVVGIGARADASSAGRWKKITVHFDVVNYDVVPVETVCDPAVPTSCTLIAKHPGFSTTGSLVGTGVEANVGAIAGTLATARGVGVFTGSVVGCGSGSFVYTNTLKVDLATGHFDEDSYSIEPGTGTGELEGITGGPWVEGVGPVRCRSHSH